MQYKMPLCPNGMLLIVGVSPYSRSILSPVKPKPVSSHFFTKPEKTPCNLFCQGSPRSSRRALHTVQLINNQPVQMTKRKRRALALAEEVSDEKSVETVKRDTSPFVYQESKLKVPVAIRQRYALNEKQAVIIETAMDKGTKIVMIDGLWGTSKTYLSVLAALQLINEKRVSGLVYLRNPLEATSTAKIGTLPGTLEERLASYNAILFDKLAELIPKPDIDRLKKEERIECIPVGLIQGKTFSCKAVIVDEAASLSHDDLMLVVSRLGERSILFIVGDSTHQLTIGAKSGFRRFFETFLDEDSMEHGVYTFELRDRDDIVRSGILRWVMEKTGAVKYAQDASADSPMFEPKVREGTRNVPNI